LNKSKTASEFGPKAVRFIEPKMSINCVKESPIMAVARIWMTKIHSIGICFKTGFLLCGILFADIYASIGIYVPADSPPSIVIVVPVIYLASEDAKNTNRAAISAGSA